LLDVGVELAALVINKEHDELEIWIVSFKISDFFLNVFLEVLGMNPFPYWLTDTNAQIFSSVGKLVDELINQSI